MVVANGEELLAFVRNCLANPVAAAARGRRAAELVRQQLGATERTFQLLLPLVDSEVGPSCREGLIRVRAG